RHTRCLSDWSSDVCSSDLSTFLKAIIAAMILGLCIVFRDRLLFALPAFFTLYLVYGFIRPRISRKVRYEIEEEEDADENAAGGEIGRASCRERGWIGGGGG